MNSTLFKIIKSVGFLLLTGISTWWTATSIYISGQQSTPLFVWIVVFFVFSVIAAYIGLRGVKSQLSNSINPSFIKLSGFFLIWIVIWGFSFATNVHRNVISQYGFNNVNAQLQSCKQYVNKSIKSTNDINEKTVKEAKETVKAEIDSLKGVFERNMDNTRPEYVGFGPECVNILNKIEDALRSYADLYHAHKTYVIYDDTNDVGDKGKGMDHRSRQELLKKYITKRINPALLELQSAIEDYYNVIKEDTELLKTLENSIRIFENSEELAIADESKDIVDLYRCYHKLKTEISDKMPEKYKEEVNKKVSDENGNLRYVVYPSDRMFVFSNVWADWWNNELPKDINLTGQFWLSFLIDFATYLLV